ncbi:hypothetical protein M970_071530 [Encephalitozoon cuniculi EcunIII-L]|nr:hypothetical protein M970_071530 [Encephalitozoon cuniculi EcunIII-L]UYI27316.1 hypothetical protein J0A71_05g11790 [Encephalitozoon cuniculi]
MIAPLILLGCLVRADIFSNVNLEKILNEELTAGSSSKLEPDSAFLSQVRGEEGMSSVSSATLSSRSISSASQVSTSIITPEKKNGEEMPIIIITQESSKNKKESKDGKEQEEKIVSIVRNAMLDSKSNTSPMVKNEAVESDNGSDNEEFREESGKSGRKDKPGTINTSSPLVGKAIGDSSDMDSYWTTVIVDNKLRKVKVNVKVMTVVEGIDDAEGGSKDGDAKEKEKKFNFWNKSEEKQEKSKDGDIPATVSVPYSKKKDEKKTSQDSKSSSSSSGGGKTKKSAESSKSTEPEVVSSSILSEKSTGSKKEPESTRTASKASASSISMSAETPKKSDKDESTSSKRSKSVASVKTRSVLSTKGKPSDKGKEGGAKSSTEISSTSEKSKHGSVTTTLLSYVTTQSISTVGVVSVSKSRKKASSSSESASAVSKELSPSISVESKKSKGGPKSIKSVSILASKKEGKGEAGKKDKDANPEMNELFYVLKNMPGKVSISKSGGKMFVEGNFVAPKEEKLKDKKFKFSGYIQATHNQ